MTYLANPRTSGAGVLARLRRWHDLRLAESRLRQLDPHLLRDLGLDSGSISELVWNRRGRG